MQEDVSNVSVGDTGDAADVPVKNEKRRICFCAVLAAALLLLDQLSKQIIVQTYQLHESTPVIPDIFSVTYVRNFGAAWGIFSGKIWLLLIIAVVVVAAMIRFYKYLTEGYIEREIALFIIFSGVVGNSIDRIWRGAVVDFIDFHYKDVWSYPVFNVADIAICVGVGIFILSGFFRPEREKKK